jgi:hypothetical protein
MFDYFHRTRRQVVEAVGYNPPEVHFRCKHPMKLGLCELRVLIAGVKVNAKVRITECEAHSAKGRWLAPEAALPYLEQIFLQRKEQRRSPRFSRTLRVKSPDFQGWSVDVSSQGIRVETQSDLGPGQQLPIEVHLDDVFDTRLEVAAQVRWCAPSLSEGWNLAGLEYQNIDRESLQGRRYERYLDKLAMAEMLPPDSP